MPTPSPHPPDSFQATPPQPGGPPSEYAYGRIPRPPSDLASQLREWADIVARGRWIILASVLAVTVPVALYVVRAPDVYQATVKLYVELDPADDLGEVLSSGPRRFGTRRMIQDELYILQNAEDLREATAQALIERGEGPGGERLPVLGPNGTAPLEAVAGRVAGRVRVRQDGNGARGVRVQATSGVPAEAALIADLYAQAYVDRTQSSSRASVTASRAFLEAQADSVQTELADREEAARTYMDREGAVRLDEEASNLVSQLAALEAERDQARVAAGMEASRAAELREQIAGLEGSLSRRLGSGTESALRQDEGRLGALRQRLEDIYLRDPSLREAPSPPADVADLRRQIATLEARVRAQSDRLVEESIAAGGVDAAAEGLPRLSALRDRLTETEVALRGHRSRIGAVQGRIAQYEAELSRIPSQTVELARLVRERESAERLALGLDQRLQEARVAESAELGYAEIIDSASVPRRPVAPNRRRMVGLGLLLGLGVGLVLAVGRTRLDQAVRRPGQLRDAGYPVLGVIPDVTRLIEDDFGGAERVEVRGREFDARLVTLISPMASAAEAFRGLRTSVQFARPDAVVQTLVVTSASPGEGKSTVASNLAVVMAQAGRRTLLVDADLRRPRVHALFGTARTPGLTDAIATPAQVAPLQVDEEGLLHVLPAGTLVPNPSEHLGSKAFRDLLDRFRGAFDVVVLDAPPVMAATDAVLVSTQTDATLLVAAAGKTKDFELEYAVEQVQAVGAHATGVVLNRFDVAREYGYRYQYAYRYGQKYTYGHDA